MELRNLVIQNPWWSEIESIKKDYYIQQFEESPIKWQPKVQTEFDFTKNIVYILRGPRQVGKTTLLMRIIRELLRRGNAGRLRPCRAYC